MVTICLQCGDEGFSNAFVYCVKCLNFAVHRYCLDEVPETLDEFVYWVCDHCQVDSSTAKSKSNGSERRNPESLEVLVEEKAITRKGKKRKIGQHRKLWNHWKRQQQQQNVWKRRQLQQNVWKRVPVISPLSTETKEKSGMRTKVKNDGFHPAETNAGIERFKASNGVNEIPFAEKWNQKQMKGNYSVANSPKEGTKEGLTVPQQAPVHINTSVELAKPLYEPIWRGRFMIQNRNYDHILDGLAAHLSTKVGLQVYEEAKLFPSLLKLDMYQKADVWPKSFQKSRPTDDSIALYFFAVDNRSEKPFDHLVRDMMCRELALKAIVENADLLVFTSNELPTAYWKFQGRYYLWGVFRAKRGLPS